MLLTACVQSAPVSNNEVDLALQMSSDFMGLPDAFSVDQRLFENRVLKSMCADTNDSDCEPNQSVVTVETDAEFTLTVQLLEADQPEAGTVVSFAFVDSMGIDIPGTAVDGVELQARSVATDERGFGSVRLMTGFLETEVTIRALVPGLRQLEWTVIVRREQVGTLEIETVYQPGSQSQGSGAFDTVTMFLLPDDGFESACENFKSDPGTLMIHSLREESGSFEVTSDSFSSLVVFNSTDSGFLYIAVGLVRDMSGTLIGFGCIRGLNVAAEETTQYDMIIDDVDIPLDYKGNYKVRFRLDLSGILNVVPDRLDDDDSLRLTRSIIFESFRQEIFKFSDGTDDRSRVLMRLFCNFVTFEGEQCSQVESYIVRGLLDPLIDQVIAVDAPLFFDALRLYGEALMLLSYVDVEVFINIRNKSPDSFGFLTDNEIRWSKIAFGRGDDCRFSARNTERCEWRWFPIHELHLDHAGQFIPLRTVFDAEINGGSLKLLYHDLDIRFGLIVTKLLETWVYPERFLVPVDSSLMTVLRTVLPCLTVDQFVGDEPFCEPFLLTNIEYIFRRMLARYNFGGFTMGFAGDARVVDQDGDRLVDGLSEGFFNVYLPALVDDNMLSGDGVIDASDSAIEAQGQARRTSLISTCFSACRCTTDPCVCEPDRCVP